MSQPRLTVAVPVYNGSRFLRQALASVLAQSLADFDLLVVDDASEDDGAAIVAAITDPRLRFVRNPERLGLVGNWNRCLELTDTPLVTVFHQDDLMAADNLARKAALLDAEPGLGMVYSDARQIDEDGEVLCGYWTEPPGGGATQRMAGAQFLRQLLSGVNPVCAPTVMLRREIVQAVGGFDPGLPFTADWEMWLRLASRADVAFIPEPLVDYRRHAAMETSRYLGVDELRHGLAAKRTALSKHALDPAEQETLGALVYRYYVVEARKRALAELESGRDREAMEFLDFAGATESEGWRRGGPEFRHWLLAEFPRPVEPPPPPPPPEERRELLAELEAQRAMVAALRGSLSWRITSPLRWLGGALRRGKR
jgi:GT2 family glycosyltransferase